jgi:hypothetical protein
MPDIDFGIEKIEDHEDRGELRVVTQLKKQYGGEPEPPEEE